MVEGIQDAIGKLKGINVAEAVLNLGIHDEFSQSKDLPHQVESVSES
jgi:hypothetical protein